ncbi:hypothetical protein BJ170DRAFT_621267 [Xylariales sp. AK1849]|nr:hypothetical protein BJ170DRAFT_621267 [Xylariales sp. AK1849]
MNVAPGNAVPQVRFYLPTLRYGPDDLGIACGVGDWIKSRGHGQYADDYLRTLEGMAQHRGLGKGKGMHTYVSY